mmetsp:Transcript_19993/g.64400  ORF Transcript_19993/g.64400 Transcript_19993/m.64400 type:complete len:351 (+) Transcript_19993:857-1909(+)
MREWPVALTMSRRASMESFSSRASTSTRGRMISATRVSWRSRTPSIMEPSLDSMPPLWVAPPTMRRSSSSETAFSSAPRRRSTRKTCCRRNFDVTEKKDPTGPRTTDIKFTAGRQVRATFSALLTPTALGSISPKKSVAAVSTPVAIARALVSPLRKVVAQSAKSAVDRTLEKVVATRIDVSARVMSTSSVAKLDRGPSSSANSFTFHGYSVVIATSAECSSADSVNSARNKHPRVNDGNVSSTGKAALADARKANNGSATHRTTACTSSGPSWPRHRATTGRNGGGCAASESEEGRCTLDVCCGKVLRKAVGRLRVTRRPAGTTAAPWKLAQSRSSSAAAAMRRRPIIG